MIFKETTGSNVSVTAHVNFFAFEFHRGAHEPAPARREHNMGRQDFATANRRTYEVSDQMHTPLVPLSHPTSLPREGT